MKQTFLHVLAIAYVTSLQATVMAEMRNWKDESGLYSVTASFVTADDRLIVLETEGGEIAILQRDQLSAEDRRYLAAHAARAISAETVELPKTDSTWHLQDGSVIKGELVGFGSQTMVVRRDQGKVWVNEYELEAMPLAYTKVLPNVIEAVDNKTIENVKELEKHLADGGGGPFEYLVEGIQLHLNDGGAITIPITLLTSSDAKEIAPNFARWKAAQAEDTSEDERLATQSRERLVLDSYQRLRTEEAVRQRESKMFELGLLNVATGITDIWEVTLLPANAYNYPQIVVVSARDSLTAQQLVQTKIPELATRPNPKAEQLAAHLKWF